MIAFLLAAQLSAIPCTTPQPNAIAGRPWVCANGGWLPPGHPDIPVTTPTPAPAPTPTAPPFGPKFRIGFRYLRNGTDIYIAGAGQLPDGNGVLFAICQGLGDGCFAEGYVRMLPATATSQDWTEVAPATAPTIPTTP